jgi:hypothetical protein
VSVSNESEHAKIREAFAAYFKDFDIALPDVIPASGGLIRQAGWNIRYTFGQDFLELYAMHRLTNDRHLKISEDGTVETLATVSPGAMFNPEIPGDRERAEREQKDSDDRLITELKQKGLW